MSTALATVADAEPDHQFYLRFAQHMLDLLFEKDFGYGIDCGARAISWAKQYQVEQNIFFPPGSSLNPLTMTFCNCWLKQVLCVDIYQYPLTEEKIRLFDELNLAEELLKQAFLLNFDQNITLAVFYCFAFLLGTLGEYIIFFVRNLQNCTNFHMTGKQLKLIL